MVMGMVAFRLAAEWVSHSDLSYTTRDEKNIPPTPQQQVLCSVYTT